MAHVVELWRYPVKSMRGERLDGTSIGTSGVAGDRRWAFVKDGRLVTARDDRRLLNTPPSRRSDFPYQLVEDEAGIFDGSPLLLVNLASVAALAQAAGAEVDHRRFRANAYLDGMEADDELRWPGMRLRLGTALLRAVELCERCMVITLDPDTLEAAPDLLRAVTRTRDALFGVLCEVIEPGYVAVGDACGPA